MPSTRGAVLGAIGIGATLVFLLKHRSALAGPGQSPELLGEGETGEELLVPLDVPTIAGAVDLPGAPTGLGLTALEVAFTEAATVTEDPGPPANDGAVQKYFAETERNGVKTGWLLGWDWCAAAVSWSVAQAAKQLGVTPRMTQRIAVWELVEDARANGTFHKLGLVSISSHTPIANGDVIVLTRAGGNPLFPGQSGHVVFAAGMVDGHLLGLSPNTGETWALQAYPPSRIVGKIRVLAEEDTLV